MNLLVAIVTFFMWQPQPARAQRECQCIGILREPAPPIERHREKREMRER